jgi:hypothetical protein
MEAKHPSLVKPTLETPFYIDFAWWQENDCSWQVHLRSALCPEHQERFAEWDDEQTIDWVDPQTAEIKPLNAIQHALMTHCAYQEDFISEHTPLLEAAFRVFLSNGNKPLSALELSTRLKRPPEMILRTLTASGKYKGMRLYT